MKVGLSGSSASPRNEKQRSVALLVLVWLVLQIGGLFSPGLLDDVDSIYIEIAREMLHRHDYVTPYIDGIRFFDKPPLMYWMAAGSMRLFGEHDWAARLPLALSVLALLLAVYGLGKRLSTERGGFYAALVLATAVGPYLYTRFFIPDILICLWMTLGVWLFLTMLERATARVSTLVPALLFGAVLGLNLLTKGLIGLVFPLGFCLIYVLVQRQWRLLPRMHLGWSAVMFAVVALPWHLLVALRNPSIAMPSGSGLPLRAGWAWFYLYNEHVARFLGKRIPHDYGNTPVWLFWLYAVIWMMPWAAFLPGGFGLLRDQLRRARVGAISNTGSEAETMAKRVGMRDRFFRERAAALTVTLWAGIVLIFFSISSRQEYYSLPALPALALMVGGMLAAADRSRPRQPDEDERITANMLRCHGWILLPITVLVAVVCGYFAIMAPKPAPGVDLAALLASNPEMYNLSLGHLFDLTGAAMGLFRGPLTAVAFGMLVLGPASYLLRRRGQTYGANVLLAGGMVVVLLAAHEGLVRFNPILGSKGLAEAIVAAQKAHPESGDAIVLDGELTSGSTLLFYTQQPVLLVNGRVNGPWFGSFWPDAPKIFEDEASLRKLWDGPRRVFLMTYHPAAREQELPGAKVLASAGGKTVLVNQ